MFVRKGAHLVRRVHIWCAVSQHSSGVSDLNKKTKHNNISGVTAFKKHKA
jgi:hypothetical protein